MSFTVESRRDGLLEQEKSKKHAVILDFLNQFIFGEVFEDMDAIQAILATWTKWSEEKAEDIHRFHKKMKINQKKMTIWTGKNPGGEFEIALINEDKE